MKTLFVTGTDTGVGKTWVSSLIIRNFRSWGIRVGGYKPVCSGASSDGHSGWRWDDVESLRKACGTDPPHDLVCPQRFLASVAPNVAARLQGLHVDDHLLSNGVQAWRTLVDWLIVEGAGGVYSPLSDSRSVLDLALELNGPVMIVAANRLGVISHTRLTVEVLRLHGLAIAAIVLNDTAPTADTNLPNSDHFSDKSTQSNADQLRHWIPDVPLCHCAWNGSLLTVLANTEIDSLAEPLWSMLTSPPECAERGYSESDQRQFGF